MYEYLCRDNYFGFHHKHAPVFLNTVNTIMFLHLGNLTGFVELETEHKCDRLADDQRCVADGCWPHPSTRGRIWRSRTSVQLSLTSKSLSASWFVEELLLYCLYSQYSCLQHIMSKQIWSVQHREGRKCHTLITFPWIPWLPRYLHNATIVLYLSP